MAHCVSCGSELPEGAAFCGKCGRPQYGASVSSGLGPASGGLESFLTFRTMITTSLSKVVYILGAVGISLAGFGVMLTESYFSDRTVQIIQGLAILLIGNLLWRVVFCEAWIILFSIHELLASIERNTRGRS